MFKYINFKESFDVDTFIIDKNKINKKNLKYKNKVNINFIGGYTLNENYQFLEYFLKKIKINSNIEDNIWGPAFTQLSHNNIKTPKEKSISIIVNSWRDFISTNNITQSIIKSEEILEIYEKFILKTQKKNIFIIITDFDLPSMNIRHGKNCNLHDEIRLVNLELKKLSNKFDNTKFLNLFEMTNKVVQNHDQSRNWHSFGKLFNLDASIYSSYILSKEISKNFYPEKKVLVVDLDNTLWGGIIGDDGENMIQLGNESPEGRVFLEIQLYIKMLKDNGVILAIVSKNEKDIALNFLKNKKNILKISDFASYRINWEKKFKNIKSLSEELNLGLDSFVFLDDNPMERMEVKKFLPEVEVPNIGENAENFLEVLDNFDYFDIEKKITKEDVLRTTQYLANKKRDNYKDQFSNQVKFMKSLKINIKFIPLNDTNIERVHQLTNKTNQFNFNTERLSKSQIKEYSKKGKKILVISASDIFGDHGIISIVYISIKRSYHIDNWVMSCRVFGKSIEKAIFDHIIKDSNSKKLKEISINFTPSQKNKVLLKVIKELQLKKSSNNKKITNYRFIVKNNKPKHYCDIKINDK
jgi:FkbH-like protein